MITTIDNSAIPTIEEDPVDAKLLTITQFVRKDTLLKKNGRIYGNWSRSYSGACLSSSKSWYIYESSIISITKLDKYAENGQKIYMYEHY